MNRRNVLQLAGAFSLAALLGRAQAYGQSAKEQATAADDAPFSEQWLIDQAQTLTRNPFAPPTLELPEQLAELSYQQYQDIAFDADQAIWADSPLPFRLQFFHAGSHFTEPVAIHLVEAGRARPVPYAASLFRFGESVKAPPADAKGGFSGLRVHGEISQPGRFDGFLAFNGASYFQAMGEDQSFGVSARGLALKTAQTAGEEFPLFRAFWIATPKPGDRHITLHALLDGQSVTGAYTFTVTPGRNTVMDVACTLFPRKPLPHVGIAPLTSMFFFGPADPSRFDDFRPRVHESEGLAIWNGSGEWIWRPLTNPERLQYSAFIDANPRGFGLLQRERSFSEYQDLDDRYGERPCAWVEPLGDWGAGSVDLVELPTDKEVHDNITAFWRPRQPLADKTGHRFRYRLHWGWTPPVRSGRAWVAQSRVGLAPQSGNRLFVLDYLGTEGCRACRDGQAGVEIRADAGEIMNVSLRPNPKTGGQRLHFEFRPKEVEQTDIRCVLVAEGKAVSEVWIYRWTV